MSEEIRAESERFERPVNKTLPLPTVEVIRFSGRDILSASGPHDDVSSWSPWV